LATRKQDPRFVEAVNRWEINNIMYLKETGPEVCRNYKYMGR
jgi:hypothetical protein